jgi:shikimate dehydrogenase
MTMYAEVIGDPIAHSKSPLIHKFWLEKLGLGGDYHATRVSETGLAEYLRFRRDDPLWRGCNVTMPHKETILPLLDSVTRNAAAIGAVNTVRRGEGGRLHGRNSDVHGIWRSLGDVEIAGKRVLVIGAGGAARAAAYAVQQLGPSSVVLMNRNVAAAERLVEDLRLSGPALPLGKLPPADIVINASAMGMEGAPWPELNLDALCAEAIVFDMVYVPLETPLLSAARSRGLRTIDGLTLLINQAAEAFATFFRHAPPAGCVAGLRSRLAQ